MGMRLRQARLHRKLTQEQLSSLSGIDQAYISKLESAKIVNPSWETVSKLASALRVKPDDLFPVEKAVGETS
jgi:transcriptional regulator with XRE-family HTH domain